MTVYEEVQLRFYKKKNFLSKICKGKRNMNDGIGEKIVTEVGGKNTK